MMRGLDGAEEPESSLFIKKRLEKLDLFYTNGPHVTTVMLNPLLVTSAV